ncbi:hypothetical protein K438DRAFT_1767301 [Mycena galopus ATCC 62051]|nr:hypothetical protein K438DRAFT_1767301 [Mycena galopus ATCC 62051]
MFAYVWLPLDCRRLLQTAAASILTSSPDVAHNKLLIPSPFVNDSLGTIAYRTMLQAAKLGRCDRFQHVPQTRLPQTAAETAAACGSGTVAALLRQNRFARFITIEIPNSTGTSGSPTSTGGSSGGPTQSTLADGIGSFYLSSCTPFLIRFITTGTPNPSGTSGIPGSPTPTGGPTTISGGPTQSGAVSAQPEPKPHTGAIVGAVIGGLAVLILVAAFVFYRARRRSEQRTAITPFVVDEQDNGTQTNEILGLSLPSSTSVVRSLSTMKRERSAARSRYRGIHTAPDGTGQPSQGLQGAHPMSSELPSTDRGSGITTRDPVAGIGNPAVLEEMHNLLAEMRRVATEHGRPYAPPSYS